MKKNCGFTFVELMIAVSIFAISALAIYSTFGAGLSAWRRTEKAQGLNQDVRLALNKLACDLENAVLYSEKDDFLNFVGEKKEISFYSLVDVYQTIPVHSELRKISYSLDESKNILQRTEQTFAESEQKGKLQEPEEIAAKIKNLNFSYCYVDEYAEPPYKWKDSWNSKKSIPQGVKIELEPDTEERLVFTKYVFIACGEKGKDE